MAIIDEIKRELSKVNHPEQKRDLVSLGMLGDINPTDDGFLIKIKTPTADRKLQIGLEAQIRQSVSKISNIGKIKIKFDVDPNLKFDDGNRIPGVKRIIAIGSGKGGVGKSTVTANLAMLIASKGYKVGLLDADIYGPSIGKLFGINGRVALGTDENRIEPVQKYGIKIISFSFLVDPNQPVVWRGPMLGKALEQFLYDVIWGELDYLVIDLPPGTGDVQLSLAQLIDINGAVIVTTPQAVATLDASKAGSMFNQVKIPILGVIENMSYFIPPDLPDRKYAIFGEGGGQKLADSFKSPLLGKIPMMMEIMQSGENGNPIVHADKNSPVVKAYDEIFTQLEKEILNWE
ncbi:MAG TPA: Mrp/NBP35 family ATP-binding protein [Leptospiraceae bacterium]|nr:Mrp/NBP35 family ATP-binding protein [Leptospiraceae bacterium]HMW04178.1 Mrp/NBP35 family ATP-binding protein [Leptospiraceae bacterium]HMX32710.1 Mrp/NBP35 family ATP-binding protein [Leptospiraceae bacterium]HMY30171.1 Mrp/NBP35 family ATP-binding protein [Leptospiraceae bacterium]HMZ65154.1 Mrp/NBP35 family ATP-binding protein [Leptospiraceae bacterium]